MKAKHFGNRSSVKHSSPRAFARGYCGVNCQHCLSSKESIGAAFWDLLNRAKQIKKKV